jgi:hypothetical protein
VIAVLVVGGPGVEDAEPPSAVEVLHARDADDAVEKLGRNRRIDAVLVLVEAAAAVAAIREDILAPPPIFLPRDAPAIAGVRRLDASGTASLLEAIVRELSGGG